MKLSVGASRIRAMIAEIPVRADRITFVLRVWPGLDLHVATMLATYPEETTISGSELRLPASWAHHLRKDDE